MVSPDAAVGGRHHFDGYPTLDIAACPGLGFPPLSGEAFGQAFNCDLFLVTQKAVY